MAQSVFFNWQDPINSFSFSEQYLGMFSPGRYCGFDTFTPSGLNFTIAHTATGMIQTDINKNATAATGILLTKQGIVIQENATITSLSCATNVFNNTSVRNDLLVLTHFKVNSPGGTPGTYSVIQGPFASTALPSLPNPTYQTIIGVISIPASATSLSAATYTPSLVPYLGNNANIITNNPLLSSTFGALNSPNFWTATQQYQTGAFISVSSAKWTPDGAGNIYTTNANITVNEIDGTYANGGILWVQGTLNTTIFNINSTPTAGGLKIRCKALENLGITTLSISQFDECVLVGMGTYWNLIGPTGSQNIYTNATTQNGTIALTTTNIGNLIITNSLGGNTVVHTLPAISTLPKGGTRFTWRNDDPTYYLTLQGSGSDNFVGFELATPAGQNTIQLNPGTVVEVVLDKANTCWRVNVIEGNLHAWVTPSLTSPFANVGSGNSVARYRKEGNKVRLAGSLASTNASTGANIFTLPPGFRPLTQNNFSVNQVLGSSGSQTYIYISVDNVAGGITYNFTGSAAATSISLDGITIPLD